MVGSMLIELPCVKRLNSPKSALPDLGKIPSGFHTATPMPKSKLTATAAPITPIDGADDFSTAAGTGLCLCLGRNLGLTAGLMTTSAPPPSIAATDPGPWLANGSAGAAALPDAGVDSHTNGRA